MFRDVLLPRARWTTFLVAAVSCVVAGAASTGTADAPPIHETLREFQPTSKYEFLQDPKPDGAPAVYFSVRAATYLVRMTSLGVPVLIRTGGREVETVAEEALVDRSDGGFDVRADAKVTSLGTASLVGQEFVVDVQGLKGKLSPTPPMLGWQKGERILTAVPEYARDAKKYAINEDVITALKATKSKVRIFVYFGTWCPTCSTVMGRVLRLEQELLKGMPAPKEGECPTFQFDYYGARPEPDTWNEPELKSHNIDVLPTGLVFIDGQDRGRILSFDWSRPETALRRVLDAK